MSYSCQGTNNDHARCLSGPEHPSPQGIAPVCTCQHHTQKNWAPVVEDLTDRLRDIVEFGYCWCDAPMRMELNAHDVPYLVCENGHES